MVVSFKNMYQSAYRTMLGDKNPPIVKSPHVLKQPATPSSISETLSTHHLIKFQDNFLKIVHNSTHSKVLLPKRPAHNKIMGYLKEFAQKAQSISSPKINLERTNYYSDLQNNRISPIQSDNPIESLSDKEVYELLELWRSLYEDEIIQQSKEENDRFDPITIAGSYDTKTENNVLEEREQNYQLNNTTLDPLTVGKSYIAIAENNIMGEITQRYQEFLEKKEASLKEKAEQRQKEEDGYFLENKRKAQEKEERIEEENRKLYNKAMDKKASNARKRFTKEQLLDGLAMLLFGSRTEERLKLGDSISQHLPPQFERINAQNTNRVERITPITPVQWGSKAIHYLNETKRNIFFKINRLYNKIFAGIYRSWVDQNVFYKCIHPERGPPSTN